MKRTKINIEDVASFANLTDAAVKAARRKRLRTDVINFFENFEKNLIELRSNILHGLVTNGRLKKIIIFDPKKRTIHAPCFKDRVMHHALMNFAGPVLDNAMTDSSFACRPGKGVHAAMKQVQKNIRRYPWYVKIDIKSYFDSIDHYRLLEKLKRRLKGHDVLKLIEKIVFSYNTIPGNGLPIGALPSQHFANYYLDSLDRYIMEGLHADAHVRYMDDIIWWCDSRERAKHTLAGVIEYVEEKLLLDVKMPVVQINRSKSGVTYCGFRILPGKIKLFRRKCRRYTAMRSKWENAYMSGFIDKNKLQSAYASVYSITAHTHSSEWRKKQLHRYPAPDC